MTDTTNTTAPDHEALLSTVEAAGAALVAALEACVAAGLCSERNYAISNVKSASDTAGIRHALAEKARPKGPMVTITYPGEYGKPDRTYQAEVGKVTDLSIILRDGDVFERSTGIRRKADRWDPTPRIAMDEVARVVATGWTPPKAPRASKAAK